MNRGIPSIFVDASNGYVGLIVGSEQVIKVRLNKSLQKECGKIVHMRELSRHACKNPLDELESLLKERQQKRPSYLIVLLSSIPHIRDKASQWFNYEVKTAQNEIQLLAHIMPEFTREWEIQLRNIEQKFENAIQSLDKIAERVKKGKITSISEIYEREPEERVIPLPKFFKEKEEEESLNLASSFLDVLDASRLLEDLITRVEREATRTLRLRRLVKIELESR